MNNYATPFIFYTTEIDYNYIINELLKKGWKINHYVSNHMISPTIFKISFYLTKNQNKIEPQEVCLLPFPFVQLGELRGLIDIEIIVINEEEFYKDCTGLIKMKYFGHNGDWLGYPNFLLWSERFKEAKKIYLKNKEEEKNILEQLDLFLLDNQINRDVAQKNVIREKDFYYTNLFDFVKFNPTKHFEYVKNNIERIRSFYA
jgi:hypothetical protein